MVIDDKVTNKLINYTIMKRLWSFNDLKYGMKVFYDTIGMSDKKYARILKLDDTVGLNEIALTMNKETTVDKNVFLGIKRLEVVGITSKEFDEYVDNIYNINYKTLSNDQIEKLQLKCDYFINTLTDRLKMTPEIENIELNLYKLYTYLVNNKPFKGNLTDVRIKRLTGIISNLSFEKLENTDKEVFAKYLEKLEEQYKMAMALSEYRKYK
jgi:hypothetical protein